MSQKHIPIIGNNPILIITKNVSKVTLIFVVFIGITFSIEPVIAMIFGSFLCMLLILWLARTIGVFLVALINIKKYNLAKLIINKGDIDATYAGHDLCFNEAVLVDQKNTKLFFTDNSFIMFDKIQFMRLDSIKHGSSYKYFIDFMIDDCDHKKRISFDNKDKAQDFFDRLDRDLNRYKNNG